MGRSQDVTKPGHPNIPINFRVVSEKRTRSKQAFYLKLAVTLVVIYVPIREWLDQVAGVEGR